MICNQCKIENGHSQLCIKYEESKLMGVILKKTKFSKKPFTMFLIQDNSTETKEKYTLQFFYKNPKNSSKDFVLGLPLEGNPTTDDYHNFIDLIVNNLNILFSKK